MFDRLFKALKLGVSCLCIPVLFFTACSKKPAFNTLNMPPGGAVFLLPLLPLVPFIKAKNTLEEMAENNRNKMEKKRAEREAIMGSCPENYEDICRQVAYQPKVTLDELIVKLEEKKPFPLDDPRTYSMIELVMSGGCESAECFSDIGEPLPPSASKSDMLLRAALLRNAVNALWVDMEIEKRNACTQEHYAPYREYYKSVKSWNHENSTRLLEVEAEVKNTIETEMRKRPVAPDPVSRNLALRLLELDQAMIAARPQKNLDAQDEFVLGMDAELAAHFSQDSEYRLWADKAGEHYLNVVRKNVSPLAGIALIRHDGLAKSEAQRLFAVRLFIKNVPDQKWLNPLGCTLCELIEPRDLQPTVWKWLNELEWYAGWGERLNWALQRGRKNEQITALMSKAYPPRKP